MNSHTTEAPAKINLSLRILGKREDGFHALETRMVPLALADRVTLTVLPDAREGEISLTCSDPSLPCDESNLAVKAARALEPVTGPLPGLQIHLEKNVPHGAGLGGGSSDAAAVLRLIRAHLRPELTDGQLHAAAASIGSDIPFFLLEGTADATGRGEIVTPVSVTFPPARVLLVKPPFGIPTPWAYKRWKDSLEVPGLPYTAQETPFGTLVNDLERPVFEKYPVLGCLKSRLLGQPGVTGALMSGSGSTVFALLEDDADLDAILAAVHEEIGEEILTVETWLRP